MSTLAFDSYRKVQDLKQAGFSEGQAASLVALVGDARDQGVTAETLDQRLELLEQRLTIRVGSLLVVAIGVLTALQHLWK